MDDDATLQQEAVDVSVRGQQVIVRLWPSKQWVSFSGAEAMLLAALLRGLSIRAQTNLPGEYNG